MILYEAKCQACGKVFKIEKKMHEDFEPCIKCGGVLERYYSPESLPSYHGPEFRKSPYDYLSGGLPEKPIKVTVPDSYKGGKNGRGKTKRGNNSVSGPNKSGPKGSST